MCQAFSPLLYLINKNPWLADHGLLYTTPFGAMDEITYSPSSSPPWRMSCADSMKMTSSAMLVERSPMRSVQRVMKTRLR